MDTTLTQALTELRLEFVASARDAVRAAAELLSALGREPDQRQPLLELRRLFHRLSGSGGTYGLPRISELGARGERECERCLEQGGEVAPADLAGWRALLDELERELAAAIEARAAFTLGEASGAGGAASAQETGAAGHGHLVIVSTRHSLPALEGVPPERRAEVHVAADPAALDSALRAHRVGLIALDLEAPQAISTIEQLRRRAEAHGVPLVAMASSLAPAARVELAQRGVARFVSPEASLAELWSTPPWPGTPEPEAGPALIASADEALVGPLQRVLTEIGMASEVVADAAQLLARDPAAAVDLLLVDEALAGADCVPLARRLRSRVALLATPLLLLARAPDAALRRAALEAGVDEVLPRDEAALLAARLRHHAALSRLLRHCASRRATLPGGALPPDAEAGAETGTARDGAAPVTLEPGEQVRVLVADDDPSLRTLIHHHLERLGWEVVLASDGEQAERALTEQAFHIALLDVLMPFRSGFDLLEWINGHRRHRPLKVVILTALGQDENLLRAFDLGADDFIAKPVSPEVIVGRLRRLLRPV